MILSGRKVDPDLVASMSKIWLEVLGDRNPDVLEYGIKNLLQYWRPTFHQWMPYPADVIEACQTYRHPKEKKEFTPPTPEQQKKVDQLFEDTTEKLS